VKYYRVQKANREEIFVNESGKEVTAALAQTNLYDRATGSRIHPLGESITRSAAISLVESCRLVSNSPAEAELLAKLIQQLDESLDETATAANINLIEACRLVSASPAEAELLAKLIERA
jgi:hypothetical protein